MKEPEINVGIVNALEIAFTLNAKFLAKGETVSGKQRVSFDEGGISWNGNVYRELTFTPLEDDSSFSLEDVTIGINFHWERQETQTFLGTLRLVVDEGKITAINQVPAEDYLTSVISSEMNATSSLEFLKAHAVISRSWLLAQIEKRKALSKQGSNFFPFLKTETEYIRWYDREDHTIFDVCADDHCQRYQGITRASNQSVVEAVKETRGQVLMHKHAICDARFSKCCGGVTEEFNYCWEDKHYPYLSAVRDLDTDAPLPDLTQEEEAERWIRQRPESFCHTTDPKILSQILNNYDQETHDFYRWKVRYTQAELAELIATHTKSDYGEILDLIRAWKIGTYQPAEDCRNPENNDHRKGTGNTTHPLTYPPVQLSIRGRQGTGSERSARMVRTDRCRMGTRCGTLSDRCCRDGRKRIFLRPDSAALLPGS